MNIFKSSFSPSSFSAFQIFSFFLFLLPSHAILDTNTNGLSDVWEKQYYAAQLFSSTNPAHAPTADPDQDGWINAQEALAGTDPFAAAGPNGKTTLHITPTTTAGTYELTWPVIPGKNYRLQASSNLHFWFNVGDIIPAPQSATSITLPLQAADPEAPTTAPPPRLFWRIKITDRDEDSDLLTTAEEFALGLNATTSISHAGLKDHWLASHFLDVLLTLGLAAVDANADPDGDTLTNFVESTITSDPFFWDSDLDMLPDAWELANTLEATNNLGNHGTEGDLDDDGLMNIDEFIHGTKAHVADTDGDDVKDKIEVDQGSDPNNRADSGQAPPAWEILEVPFRVGDPSGSDSEIWKMIIQGTGPDDTRKFEVVSPTYGEMADKTLKLRKWNRYTITIQHVATDRPGAIPDYDWEAQADGKPATIAEPETAVDGTNNFFTVKDHWLVDNRHAILTADKPGDAEDIVNGKAAYLVPIVIHDVGNKTEMLPTGTDDVSVTANPASRGYKPNFWIMAPQGDKNEMYFQIPLTPDAKLSYTSSNATPTPTNIMLHADPWSNESPLVTWRGIGQQTTDVRPTFQIGRHNTDIELPIQVMSMKKRTVKVAIFPVKLPSAGRDVPVPDKTALEAWLNAVFGDQINAWFEVTYKPKTEHNYMSSDEEYTYLFPQLEDMFSIPAYNPVGYDMRVFLVDLVAIGHTQLPILPPPDGVVGIHHRGSRSAIALAGGSAANNTERPLQDVIETIAHEIGHVMIGPGHPDQNTGPAPLEGTDRTFRLMSSGAVGTPGVGRVPRARLLVKEEWNEAESWLKIFVD